MGRRKPKDAASPAIRCVRAILIKRIKSVARERDALRAVADDCEDLIASCDDAVGALESAIEALSRYT